MVEGELTILKGDEYHASLPDVSLATSYIYSSHLHSHLIVVHHLHLLYPAPNLADDKSIQPQSAS